MDKPQNYIKEIDGLRALAVVLVIIYHLGLSIFPGGFLGVDVFFVISGFLITKIIINDISNDIFSLSKFYKRRFKRLLPALFVVIAIASIFVSALLTPDVEKAVWESVPFSLISLSNIHFWSLSGYFDDSAITKPFLHTWSLGVEEQFYLFWPLLLMFAYKKVILVIAIAAAVSFASNLVFIQDNASVVFYMMPFRIFQFALGGLLALKMRPNANTNPVNDLFFLAGLAAILYCSHIYTEETLFPGLNAIVPTLATLALLYSCSSSKSGQLLFGNKFSVHLGKISYSLYLVHWPIISIYASSQFLTAYDFSVVEVLSCAVATYALALILHFAIETRFRHQRFDIKKIFIVFGLPCLCLSLTFSYSLWRQHTEKNSAHAIDLHVDKNTYKGYAYKELRQVASKSSQVFPDTGKLKVLLIGDSQGGDFLNMLGYSMYRDKIEIKALTVGARCQLVLSSRFEVNKYIGEKHRKQCQNQQNRVLNSKLIAEADTIIIGLSWRPWSIELLPDTLDKLRELGAKKVAVLSLKEQFQSGYTYASLELPLDEIRRQMYSERKKRVLSMNDSLQKLSPEVHYIDAMALLCEQAIAECEFVSDKRNILLYDRNHLTFEGTKYLGKKMNKLRTLDFLFN